MLATLALALVIIIVMNPPTDFDGGPLMAYNFLFFFPIFLTAGLLAIVSLIVSFRKLISKEPRQKRYPVFSIMIASLVLLYFVIVALGIYSSAHDAELEALISDMDKPSEIYNNSVIISLETDPTLYLIAFNWGKGYEQRLANLSLEPYACEKYKTPETYVYRGDQNCELYFKRTADSLFVYIADNTHAYTYINASRLDEIPVKTIKLDTVGMDSLRKEHSLGSIEKLVWK